MSCDCKGLYTGKIGLSRDIITATIAATSVSTNELVTGDSVHNSYLSFDCMTLEEGDTSKIVKAEILLTDTTIKTDAGFRLWLFDSAPSSQTSGNAVTLSTASTLQAMIELNTGVQVGDTLTAYYITKVNDYVQTTTNNKTIYGVLENIGNITYEAPTIAVRLFVEKD